MAAAPEPAAVNWLATGVEAAISGVVVVVGVVLAAWIDRTRSRKRAIEVAFVAMLTPMQHALAAMVDPHVDREIGSMAHQQLNRAVEALTQIELQARGFRGAKKIADAAEELLTYLLTANSAALGRTLSPLVAVYADTHKLRDAIYGPRGFTDEEMKERTDRLLAVRAEMQSWPLDDD